MIIDKKLLDSVTEKAKESPRLRMNFNFHKSPEDKSQRLLNAIEPCSVLPIHRHMSTEETYIVIRGSIKVMFYNDTKEVVESFHVNPLQGSYGVNIPAGQWHTLEVLESGSVIFEVKDGPYQPIDSSDILQYNVSST